MPVVAATAVYYRSALTRSLVVLLLVNVGLLAAAPRAVSAGSAIRVVYLLAAGLWAVSLWTSLAGNTLYPFTAVIAVLPAIIAIPYVSPGVLLRLVLASSVVVGAGSAVVASGAALALGVPDAVLLPVLAVALCMTVEVCAVSLWQTNVALGARSAWLEAANRGLRASEAELERKVAERTQELERSQRELGAARDEALSANRHKSGFLASMSHELRTPLNAIIRFSEVLSENVFGPLNEKQSEYVTDVNASGHALLGLINDILEISKIEAGGIELSIQDVDLATALEQAMMRFSGEADDKGVRLEAAWAQDVAVVRADPRRLGQILDGLLSNAVKFTGTDGVVRLEARTAGRSTVVSVSDTGIGIPESQLEHVFEPFQQADLRPGSATDGFGLGLALAKRLIGCTIRRSTWRARSASGARSVSISSPHVGSGRELRGFVERLGRLHGAYWMDERLTGMPWMFDWSRIPVAAGVLDEPWKTVTSREPGLIPEDLARVCGGFVAGLTSPMCQDYSEYGAAGERQARRFRALMEGSIAAATRWSTAGRVAGVLH